MFISDIIESIVNRMDRKLKVVSLSNEYTAKFCSLKWISLFSNILIDGVLQPIVEINHETKEVTFKVVVNSNTTFELPNVPIFIGTRMKASSEWLTYSDDMREKIPFIWLWFTDDMRATIPEDRTSPITETWRNITVYFVADVDRQNWRTKQILDDRTKVLSIMMEAFITSFKADTLLKEASEIDKIFHPIFGVEQVNGSIKDIIDANTTATSLNFDFDSYYSNECCKC